MDINALNNKRILVVVAHQDDESLYFGGLLSLLQAKIKIICMTKPMAGRPDTDTRINSFKRACAILGCEYALYDLNDHPAITDLSDINYQYQTAKKYINSELQSFDPEFVITHNLDGEINTEYPTGHAMHKLISLAVASMVDKNKLIYCGLNSNCPDMVISYYVERKRKLIDCYLPNWSPISYPFAYDQEKYVMGTNGPTIVSDNVKVINDTSVKPLKLMVICWGYSIHAKRRIQIFAEDPAFAVTVVATYNYNFPSANNVLLMAARVNPIANKIWGKLMRKLVRPECTWLIDYFILLRAVQAYRPDVILLQTLMYPCWLAYSLPRRIPQIITFWNGDVIWWAKWNGIERLLKKQIVTYGARRATAITVNSQTARSACLKYGVGPDRVHLIGYPGVDANKFFPQSKALAREQLGITSPQVILWPRGLGGFLNSELFVQAIAQVAEQYPDVLAVVLSGVGGPNELQKHQTMAQTLQIEHNFRWIGQINFEDMPLYYNSADAMVSINSNDSRPNVMLEAMACGTPVIMGDIPQIHEWVTDSQNGYLVPIGDPQILAQKIMQVLDDKNQATNRLYSEKSLQIVRERADNQKNSQLIKQLVSQTAQPNKSL